MRKSTGDLLKELRGDRSLETVAEAVGVSKQAISNYENNVRVPRDEIKSRLSIYYGKSVQEIFFDI